MRNVILKKHFLNPQNMGNLDNPSYQAIVKSDICNDIVRMMVVINTEGIIQDIKAQVYGCGYSIAGASLFTEIAKGRRAGEILEIAQSEIDKISVDIPERRVTCISLPKLAYEKIFCEYLEVP